MRRCLSGIRGFSVFEILTPKVNSADPCGRISISFDPKIFSKPCPPTLMNGAKSLLFSLSACCCCSQNSEILPAKSKSRYSSKDIVVRGRKSILSPTFCTTSYSPVSGLYSTLYSILSGSGTAIPLAPSEGLGSSSLGQIGCTVVSAATGRAV